MQRSHCERLAILRPFLYEYDSLGSSLFKLLYFGELLLVFRFIKIVNRLFSVAYVNFSLVNN